MVGSLSVPQINARTNYFVQIATKFTVTESIDEALKFTTLLQTMM